MPWTKADAKKHNKRIRSNRQAEVWTKVANETLKKTGDEGKAVRYANTAVMKMTKVEGKGD